MIFSEAKRVVDGWIEAGKTRKVAAQAEKDILDAARRSRADLFIRVTIDDGSRLFVEFSVKGYVYQGGIGTEWRFATEHAQELFSDWSKRAAVEGFRKGDAYYPPHRIHAVNLHQINEYDA